MSRPLLIDLTGVARLADVRRPVASVWRSRFAGSADPFPPAIASHRGRPHFDAVQIAQWLDRTGHGNNPDVIADAAASAAPDGFDFADPAHVATIDALLTLHAMSGVSLSALNRHELDARAASVDPDDSCLRSEVMTASAAWVEWAERLADAAYSPAQASRLMERRHTATLSASGPSGPLTPDAHELLLTLATALADDRHGHLVLHGGVTAAFAADLLSRLGGALDPVVPATAEGRALRRRLQLDEVEPPSVMPTEGVPRLLVARFPSAAATTTLDILEALDELGLGMRDEDRAVVLAPATALTDRVSGVENRTRTDALRSGRVRAIVKLPTGLVTAAPRTALALWILGREAGGVPMADRLTAVADLTGVRLTAASRADLTSDVIAVLGDARDVRGHAFRFTRLVPSGSLAAARGALLGAGAVTRPSSPATRDLPAMLDQASADLGGEVPRATPAVAAPSPIAPATIEHLRKERHLRVLPGTRLAAHEFVDAGLVVVGVDELDDPARVGTRHVDRLTFAAQHPSARLTVPGDVVFRTAPIPQAWVDPDGSKVVAHPARVLRVDPGDPGGLVPELIAADIGRSPGGPAAWRRWVLRRVAPRVAPSLRAALADIAENRAALLRRVDALDRYSELLAAGVVSGAVILSDPAATASDPQ